MSTKNADGGRGEGWDGGLTERGARAGRAAPDPAVASPSRAVWAKATKPRWANVPLVDTIAHLADGLIVSCQAGPDDPLFGSGVMAMMARAAAAGGAVAIRANGAEDIASIRAAVDLPIIGIWKVDVPGFGVRITPELAHARTVAAAGASIIALDATDRARSDGLAAAELIKRVRAETGLPVMADVSSVDEGLIAQEAGADLIATTLAGYTTGSAAPAGPDLDLVSALALRVDVPVIAEGRISTPEEAVRALRAGAYAVVVGHAITRPEWITARFVTALRAR
jgi:N-acylglucosamine-6-phosphate 2-epimerase